VGIAGAADEPDDWTEPGAHRVAAGVYRIPLPLPQDGLRAVNIYAVVGEADVVLIDGGWALDVSRRRLEMALARLDRELGDVSRFLVTHIHRDHYTQAVVIGRELGIRVSLGDGERPGLEAINQPGRHPYATQIRKLGAAGATPLLARLAAQQGERELDLSVWAPPDDWITDGAQLDAGGRLLTAIRTPGHTQGHVVYADPTDRVLFAGDHVLPHITPSIGLEPVNADLPLGDYLHSLAAMRELPDMWLLPAHGPVTTSVHARVDELVAHHHDRLDATARAVAAGTATAYAAARALRWTRRNRGFDELDLFNQTLAVGETLAHLDLLVAHGRLTATTTEAATRFSTPD
jgi:glyoxylase-like metal-dependent hydrolase (beta-lactamase superfamily II)